MLQAEFTILSILRTCIEAVSAFVIVAYCVGGCYVLATTRDIRKTQLIVAHGALLGMTIKLIAALLAVIQLRTWDHIALFACVIALRTILKKAIKLEMRRTERPALVPKTGVSLM